MRGIKDGVKFLAGNLGFKSNVTGRIGRYLSRGSDYNEGRLLPRAMAWETWTRRWVGGVVWGQTAENTDFLAIIIGWVWSGETLRGPQSILPLKPQQGQLRGQCWWDLPQVTLCPLVLFWCNGHSEGPDSPCIPITTPADPKLLLATILCPNCALPPGRDRHEATVLVCLRAGLKPKFARMLLGKPSLNAPGRGWEG